jgi:hypothetical protein
MQITSEYRVIHKTGSKEHKQITVNVKDSKLNKNRIAAKNEILQTVLCSQIDNKIDFIKKLEYRQNRAEQQKQSRQAKRR